MKKPFILLFASLFLCSDLSAKVDRYKSDVDVDKTINHITYELPLYYAKDRTNLVGSYTLATNVRNKQSGSLSFEFKENDCELSQNLRKAILRVMQDYTSDSRAHISIGFELASGETFIFDASYFQDWKQSEWRNLVRVTYNKDTEEYRSYIMFPLDYLVSSKKNLSGNSKTRYKYLLKVLAESNIKRIFVKDMSEHENINISIPIHRPTAETMDDMINRKKVKPASKREKKYSVQNGRQVK